MRGGYFGTRPFGVPGWRCRCSRAPSGPAAREIATRELRSEWSISKPARALRTLRRPPHRQRWVVVCGGQALPPPTDTAAIPPGPLAPSTPAAPSAPAALGRCVWWPGPAAAHGYRGDALRRPPHRRRCVVVCGGQALPPPTDTAAMPPGSPAPSTLRTHVVSCVAAPGGRILIRTVGIVLREVSGKASPGPLQAFWSRGGYESMSGCDRASQAHTEAPGAVAPGALAAIRCELSEPNATRSVAA